MTAQAIAPEKKHLPRARGTGGLVRVKGSRFWYLLYWSHGRQIRESAKTESKMVAETLLRKRLGEEAIGRQPAADVAKLRYEDLRNGFFQEYKINGRKSLRHRADNGQPYISNSKHLDAFFSGHKVNSITADAIRKFVLARQAAGAGNASINRALSQLKKMFNLAKRDGKIQISPHMELLKEPPARKGFLEPDGFKRLRQELPEYLRAAVTLAFYTGMRLGEIRNLRWENVDLAEHVIRLNAGETKNDAARVIPLNVEIVETLDMLRHKAGSVQVFGNGKTLGQFRKSWRSACVRAGLGKIEKREDGTAHYSGLVFHDLRRTGVRNLVRAGVPEVVAMAISGHRTRSVFERYNIVSERDLKDAVRKLDQYLAEKEIEARLAEKAGEGKILDTSLMKVGVVQ